jgi:hypothetical protein
MANNSLLSVGQLCNECYYVTFKLDGVTIFNSRGHAILKGVRDLGTGLWRINLRKNEPESPIASANNVYELCNTGALVNYLNKALFSPTKSALLHAVKQGNLITWPGLTKDAIHKHLKMTPATAMGRMNKNRQNIRSTSKIVEVASDLEDVSVTPVGTGEKTVKLPQPQPRARTYTQTCQSTLRATQVRAALSHAYAVTYQNKITDKP